VASNQHDARLATNVHAVSELLRLSAVVHEETEFLLASQLKAARVLRESQDRAAGVLKRSQKHAADVLRGSNLLDVESIPSEHRGELLVAYEAAAAALKEMQTHATDTLMAAQREAAAILLEATMKVLDGRSRVGDEDA